MDVGDYTTSSNRSLDERVEFFVTTNSELQVTGSNALHAEVLRGITG